MTNRLNLSLLYAVQDKNLEEVESLLRKGADPNTKTNNMSPLLLASGFNEVDICRTLLIYGANPNTSPNGVGTPLITAASYGYCEIVRLLVEAGGDPEVKDSEGLNAHYWAYKSKCRSCSNFLMETKRSCDGFKKVHFSESCGNTSESSLSKMSSLSEDNSKLSQSPFISKPSNQNSCYSPNSAPKSPIKINLSSSDMSRLKSILGITDDSPNKAASFRRPVSPWLSPPNGNPFDGKRLSSSTGNLSNHSLSNQFSKLVLHPSTSSSSQKLKSNNLTQSTNTLSHLPPKMPRFGLSRVKSPRPSPSNLSGQKFDATRNDNSSPMKNIPSTPNEYSRYDSSTNASSSEPAKIGTSRRSDLELTDGPSSDSRRDDTPNNSGYLWQKVKSYFSGLPPLISSQHHQKTEDANIGRNNFEKSAGQMYSPSDSYSLLSSDGKHSESFQSSDDPCTIQVTPVSFCVELDVELRKSSSESKLSGWRLVDEDDDDDDDLTFSGTLDKAFCETFSASCPLANGRNKNEFRDNEDQKKFTKDNPKKFYTFLTKNLATNQTPDEHVISIPGDPKTDWSFGEILGDVERMKDAELRSRLMIFKVNPGPILKSTRRTYQLKLAKLIALKKSGAHVLAKDCFEPSLEIIHICSNNLDMSSLDNLESDMSRPFMNPDPLAKWRQGIKKNCFNYLLLDPRVTLDLPKRVKVIGHKKGFLIFVESIFYIGKGQKTRPYEHLKEASIHASRFIIKTTSKKVAKILEIWKAGFGVVSLCAFQNAIPVESLTKEACMIEAIGINNLTNVCRGQMYGPASKWSKKDTRRLGSWLLWKSFMILLNEGERQITFKDVSDFGIS